MTSLRLLPVLMAALLSACSHTSRTAAPDSTTPELLAAPNTQATEPKQAPQTPAVMTVRQHVDTAMQHLNDGDESSAREHLAAALAKSPTERTARSLMRQLETEPTALLGEAHTTYVVRPGDTLSALAGRFLDDPMLFYALSRYNGLSRPNQISVGQVLKIPGAEPLQGGASHAPQLPATRATDIPDPQRAATIRLKALQHLNLGQVDQAVALLKQAKALDGSSALIAADLDRALRIQSTLESKRS